MPSKERWFRGAWPLHVRPFRTYARPVSVLLIACFAVGAVALSHVPHAAAGTATHFVVTAPGSATAGTAFSFTVTAEDSSNAVDTSYNGTVGFTSSTVFAVTLPGNSTLTNGVGTFSATLGAQTSSFITATDTVSSSIRGTSNAVVVSAGAATRFVVSSPTSATAGVAFPFTVTGLDSFGNTHPVYAGTVHFTSSDGSAVLPTNSTLTGAVGTFSATLTTVGSRTITATDTLSGSIAGTSVALTVSAGAASHFAMVAPSSATAATAFSFTVIARDQFENTVTGYAGTVHFTSTDGLATLPANATLTNGVGTFAATLKTVGSRTITVTDTVANTLTRTSNAIAVASSRGSGSGSTSPAPATTPTVPSRPAPDTQAPTTPLALTGSFAKGSLLLSWQRSSDNVGVDHYELYFDGTAISRLTASVTDMSTRELQPHRTSVYTVVAFDAAGNQSGSSNAVSVGSTTRPANAPKAIPGWAWKLLRWQENDRQGVRPATPAPLLGWFAMWKAWRLAPFHVVGAA